MKNFSDRIKSQLAELDEKGLRRSLSSPNGLDFSSNDFLCLANDERLINSAIAGLHLVGVGSTGSRLLRGERIVFAKVEQQFAEWKVAEKSLYFSSGYQANVGLISTITKIGDVIFSDELNHASLIDGIRLSNANKVVYPHLDFEKLGQLLRETDCKGQKFLITESLFSMDGDVAPLDKYAEICAETNTVLIVDEAHAVGIYGKKGSGLIEHFGLNHDSIISINTAGKALGVSGAFVAGSADLTEFLINRCRSFIYSTAPLPICAVTLSNSIEVIQNEPDRRKSLLELSEYFHQLLKDNGFAVPNETTQIIPILIGDSKKAVDLAHKMQLAGFDIRAIRPPTVPHGTSRLRVSLNIGLTKKNLEDFIQLLTKHFKN